MEQKGPIELFNRIRAGAKAARGAYKVGVEAEKLNQVKAAKRAAAAQKAKATREAKKAARIKAAEEAAKPKRGRPRKAAPVTPEPKPTAKKGTKSKVENTNSKANTDKKSKSLGLKPFLLGALATTAISQIGTKKASKASAVKPVKATPADTIPFKPKGIVGKVYKSAGRYKFAKGGVKKRK